MRILLFLISLSIAACSPKEGLPMLDGVWVFATSETPAHSEKQAEMIEPFPAKLLEFKGGFLREVGSSYSEENEFEVVQVDDSLIDILVHYDNLDEKIHYRIKMEDDEFWISCPAFESPRMRFERAKSVNPDEGIEKMKRVSPKGTEASRRGHFGETRGGP